MTFGAIMLIYGFTPQVSGGQIGTPGRMKVQSFQERIIPVVGAEAVEIYKDSMLRSKPQKRIRFADRNKNKELYEGLTPEEKAKLDKKYQKWEKLSPDEKKELRNKMKKLQTLPPDDRRLYEDRFEQWKRLPPEERRAIKEKLEKGNGLSPREKEEIRKKFKKGSD